MRAPRVLGSVRGVGVNDAPFPMSSPKPKSYQCWVNLIARCYGKPKKTWACYAGCTVDTSWHSYMAFKEWYDVNHSDGWDLEKDLLASGNKVYGPNKCVFVPRYVNQSVINLNARGYFELKRGGFNVVSGKTYHGSFKTATEARECWVKVRVSIIRSAIERYELEASYDPRVVTALNRIINELEGE